MLSVVKVEWKFDVEVDNGEGKECMKKEIFLLFILESIVMMLQSILSIVKEFVAFLVNQGHS